MQKITHAAVGLATAVALGTDPWYTLAGALIPDLDYVTEHRKLLHNVWVVAALFAAHPALGIGAITHVLLDMLTVMGVALFWPISSRRFGVRIARTGGILDWVLFLAAVGYLAWVMI